MDTAYRDYTWDEVLSDPSKIEAAISWRTRNGRTDRDKSERSLVAAFPSFRIRTILWVMRRDLTAALENMLGWDVVTIADLADAIRTLQTYPTPENRSESAYAMWELLGSCAGLVLPAIWIGFGRRKRGPRVLRLNTPRVDGHCGQITCCAWLIAREWI